jgi:DNA polymerase-4
VSGTSRIFGPPENLARRLKAAILEETGLTCSVGIAPNKFLAKIASDWDKPDGLTVIRPEDVQAFLRDLPLGKIPGVGKRMAQELAALHVATVQDILARPRDFWEKTMGKRGAFLLDRARGIDESPVVPHTQAQSCSAENTLDRDTLDRTVLERRLLAQAERVGRELRGLNKKGLTVTLKIKFNDFSTITRSRTLPQPTDITSEIYDAARRLLAAEKLVLPVRLIGTGVSNFRAMQALLPMADDPRRGRDRSLDQAMDRIRDKFGTASIRRADVDSGKEGAVEDLLSGKNRISDTE